AREGERPRHQRRDDRREPAHRGPTRRRGRPAMMRGTGRRRRAALAHGRPPPAPDEPPVAVAPPVAAPPVTRNSTSVIRGGHSIQRSPTRRAPAVSTAITRSPSG